MNPENDPKNPAESVGGAQAVEGVLRFPGFEVDLGRGELRIGGQVVALRPKTFTLLTYLAQHPRRLLAKEALVQAVWPDVIVTDDSLVQCVSELRSALGDHQQQVVRTVPRRGYILELQPVGLDQADAGRPIPPAPLVVERSSSDAAMNRRRIALALAVGLIALTGASSWVWWHRERTEGERGTMPVGRRSIAVLPFANLSGDPSQAYFAEGITADVIADVSRLPDTLVMGQASTQTYRDTASDVRRAGQDLEVHFVVTGGVWRSGSDVRINVQLLSAESGTVLWADTLEYPDESQWNWRRDLGPRIANALDIRIMDVVGGWGADRPEPRDAIDHIMRGFAELRRASARSDWEAAADEFRAALKTAPKSASAWAGLSLALAGQIFGRHIAHPQEMLREADEAANKALAIDVNNATAHFALGQVLILRGRLEAAQAAFESCLSLNPSHAHAHMRIGLIRIELGHAEEAQQHVDMALRLSPMDQTRAAYAHLIAGIAQFHLGHDDEAYAEMEKMVAADPRVGFAYMWMASIDGLHGRTAKAHENLDRYKQYIEIQTISGLKATERSTNPVFLAQRERFYDGLRKAGLPE
ncbi:hypothetical protein GCM10027419_11180 [Pandoraea terrae]